MFMWPCAMGLNGPLPLLLYFHPCCALGHFQGQIYWEIVVMVNPFFLDSWLIINYLTQSVAPVLFWHGLAWWRWYCVCSAISLLRLTFLWKIYTADVCACGSLVRIDSLRLFVQIIFISICIGHWTFIACLCSEWCTHCL